MQSASGGVSGVAATAKPAARQASQAAVEQADVAAAGLAEVERRQRRYPRIVGDQHYGLAPVGRRRNVRPDRPHGLRDVALAVGHAGAQVDDLRLTLAQSLRQLARSHRS